MSKNIFDYPRFSTFVESIVARKIKSVSDSIVTSTGYLKSLVTSSKASADASASSAAASQTSASNAKAVWQDFTSTYLGVAESDPTRSSLDLRVNPSAIYIRKSDRRLRMVTKLVGDTPSWDDVQLRADPVTVVEAGRDVFLFLDYATRQIVKSPVTFSSNIRVPYPSTWTSQDATNAASVNDLTNNLQTTLTQMIVNARTQLQTNIDNNRTALQGSIDGVSAALNNFKNLFSSGSNEQGTWERRPGILEQWGYLSATAGSDEPAVTVSLPQDYGTTDYHVLLTPSLNNPAINKDTWVQNINITKSSTSFQVQYQRPGTSTDSFGINGFEWRCIGKTS